MTTSHRFAGRTETRRHKIRQDPHLTERRHTQERKQTTKKGGTKEPTRFLVLGNEPHKAPAIDRCSTLEGAKYRPTPSSHVVGIKADGAAKGVGATGDKKTTEEPSNNVLTTKIGSRLDQPV